MENKAHKNTVPASISDQGRSKVIENILHYGAGGMDQVNRRLRKLTSEWDTDRVAELNTGLLGLAGTALALFANKGWLGLTIGVSLLMVQHAVQGKGPLASLFRKLGLRTREEIDAEKFALKAVSGGLGKPVSAYQAASLFKN